MPIPEQPAKRRVYSGIVYWPNHPDADMHGRVHFCIRAKDTSQVIYRLGLFGVGISARNYGTYWSESLSSIEDGVTKSDFGILFTCSMATAYLHVAYYSKPSPNLLLSHMRREKEGSQESHPRPIPASPEYKDRER